MAQELRDLVERLGEDHMPDLTRTDALGELDFSDSIPDLRVVRSLVQAFLQQPLEEVPETLHGQVVQQVSGLAEQLDQIESFTLAQDQAATQHTRIVHAIGRHKKWFVEQVRPHIRAMDVDTSEKLGQLQQAVASAEEAESAIRSLLSNLRRSAGETGAGRLSDHYANQAGRHKDLAQRYFRALLAALMVTLFLIVFLFLFFPPELSEDSSTSVFWGAFVRGLVYRLLLLGVLSYGLAFLARNYRSERHLQILNESKQAALDTYGLFLEATEDEGARTLILGELVRSVFAAPDSGLVGGAEERTILETNPGLQAFFASQLRE